MAKAALFFGHVPTFSVELVPFALLKLCRALATPNDAHSAIHTVGRLEHGFSLAH